jgi:putative addiction module component (TIGR02574 family)
MSSKDILQQALKLNSMERLSIVEGLLKSLDEPDSTIDDIWAEEAEKRLNAYRAGNLEGIASENIFREE